MRALLVLCVESSFGCTGRSLGSGGTDAAPLRDNGSGLSCGQWVACVANCPPQGQPCIDACAAARSEQAVPYSDPLISCAAPLCFEALDGGSIFSCIDGNKMGCGDCLAVHCQDEFHRCEAH
jgi:hypothetical protein